MNITVVEIVEKSSAPISRGPTTSFTCDATSVDAVTDLPSSGEESAAEGFTGVVRSVQSTPMGSRTTSDILNIVVLV